MAFTGFPKSAPRFWPELAAEMSKGWFDANKARYESEWVTPMKALLDDVAVSQARALRDVVRL